MIEVPGELVGRAAQAVINLNGPGRYVHWGFIQISVANLVVIVLDDRRVRGGDPRPVPPTRRG